MVLVRGVGRSVKGGERCSTITVIVFSQHQYLL